MKSPWQGVIIGFVCGLAVGIVLSNWRLFLGIAIVATLIYFYFQLRPKRP